MKNKIKAASAINLLIGVVCYFSPLAVIPSKSIMWFFLFIIVNTFMLPLMVVLLSFVVMFLRKAVNKEKLNNIYFWSSLFICLVVIEMHFGYLV